MFDVRDDQNSERERLCVTICLLHANLKTPPPQDVDIIVLNLWDSWDVEDVKALLVESDDSFFLVPSRNPRNNYMVLWYSLPPRSKRSCKVDILVPGIVEIPRVPESLITYTNIPDIPVMPFLALLLLKLRGWDDHRSHTRQDMVDKQHVDVEDIDELLDLAINHYGVHLSTESWMPKSFVKSAKARLREYVDLFPDTAWQWNEIGFNV
jgi:hypothetical protein